MNEWKFILPFLIILSLILVITMKPDIQETFTTYVNSPGRYYSTQTDPWASPGVLNWRVIADTIRNPYWRYTTYTKPILNRAVPWERRRSRHRPRSDILRISGGSLGYVPYAQNIYGTGQPMVTSVKTPFVLGVWQQIGTAYTSNPADDTVVNLYQQALDPGRDFYQYKIVTSKGFEIPLDTNITELKNGETFTVPGWDSKGEFVANITTGGYSYVYV